jgi:uncharacterized repeat protein (TIGR01451 family)
VRLNRLGLGREFLRGRGWLGLVLLAGVGGVLLTMDARTVQSGGQVIHASGVASKSPALSPVSSAQRQQVRAAYNDLPLMFEPNQGQADPKVRFLARGLGYGLFLTADQAVLRIQSSTKDAFAVSMTLAGANSNPAVVGSDQLPGKSNYFIGNDPQKWHHDIPQFARVRYQGVYPGIDLVYYGNQGRLEYDFEVAPGADPKRVELRFRGSDSVRIDESGNLVLAAGTGNMKLLAPRVYQTVGQEQRPVAAKFVLRGKDQVAFDLANYDRSRALIIDPQLAYSTYLGGSNAESCSVITGLAFVPSCPAIAVDSALNAYIAGSTKSTDFPPVPGRIGSLSGVANVYIAKFNSQGSALAFSTIIGGKGTDYPAGVAVDSGFNVFVAGTTDSLDFPTLGGLTPILTNGNHVFVTKLTSGANLLYSTFLAGSGIDSASGMAIDSLSKIYVTGTTTSTDFPTTPNSLSESKGFTPPGTVELFFSKVDPTLVGSSSLLYSSYLGGTSVNAGATPTAIGGGVAVDTNCNAYISGGTNYTDMPLANAYQGAPNSLTGTNAYLAELEVPTNSNCGSDFILNYGTYFGGTGSDVAYGVAVDVGHTAYITGSTTSNDLALPPPTTDTIPPFQVCPGVPNPAPPAVLPTSCTAVTLSDAFVAKFTQPITTGTTPGDVTLSYFSYLGGSGQDAGLAIVVDTTGGARITGLTKSGDFPVSATPLQSGFGGGTDAFYARIDTTTTTTTTTTPTTFSSYLGGSGTDIGTGVALDFQSNSYVTGETSSPNFPTLTPFQAVLDGPSDAFVTALGPTVNLPVTVIGSPTPVGVGNPVTFKYTITNKSDDPTSGVVFNDSLAGGVATFVSATASPGSCGSVANQGVSCSIGLLGTGTAATVTITLTPTAAGSLPNSGHVTAPVAGVSSQTSVTVNDFTVGPAPGSLTTATVLAGVPATYEVEVTPTGSIPNSVTLSCGGSMPSGATCTFTEGAIINNLNTGPQQRQLRIDTLSRVTTTTGIPRIGGPFYAMWFPVSGLTLIGVGVGGKESRRRRVLMGILLAGFFALVLFQSGCGSSSSVTTTTGTPAGTYNFSVDAKSGTITRTMPIQLTVQ